MARASMSAHGRKPAGSAAAAAAAKSKGKGKVAEAAKGKGKAAATTTTRGAPKPLKTAKAPASKSKELFVVDAQKAKPKFHPGIVAMREMRKLQNSDKNIGERAPFARMVRRLAREIDPKAKLTQQFIDLVFATSQNNLNAIFRSMVYCCINSGKKRVGREDFETVKHVASTAPQRF